MQGIFRNRAAAIIIAVSLIAIPALIAGCTGGGPGGNTYHVATWGSDENDGLTKDSAFGSIQYAIDKYLQSGDTLIIHGGVYNERLLFEGRDYSSPVVITAADEAEDAGPVILDGSKDAAAGDIQLEMIKISDSSNIRIEGLTIRNNNTPHGGWHAPMGILVTASAAGGCDNIQIVNNKIYNIDGETWGYRAYMEDDEEFNCDMNGHGIAVYGEGWGAENAVKDVLIQGNEVFDCKLGQSESVVVNGNVDGFQILQNYVHDNDNIGIDAIGGEGTSGDWDDYLDEPIDSGWDYARGGVISGNVVINCSANSNQTYGDDGGGCDGIYIDGARDVLIENNYVIASDYCIEIGTERNGDYDIPLASGITVRNNIVSYGAYGGILVGGTYGAKDNVIENNTSFAPVVDHLTGEAEPCVVEEPQDEASNNLFTKNIFIAADDADGMLVYRLPYNPLPDMDGYIFDDNVYWKSGVCPVSLDDGNFTARDGFGGYGADAELIKDAMGEELFNMAKNNYTARRAALPDFAAAYSAINGEKDRSMKTPLQAARIGDNLCRYFEGLPGVPDGTIVGMKHMGSVSRYAGGQAINGVEDGAAKYYGYIQIGREDDGRLMLDKIAAGGPRTINNIVIYFKVPYQANGQTSYIVKQVGLNITSGAPTESGSVRVDFP